MEAAPPSLAALVASRICHDLGGPLGAIANGLELMAMTGASTPESELVADSAAAATARLRLFRLTYGVSSEGQVASHGEVRAILKAAMARGRLSCEWAPTGECLRDEARCALLLVQCLETAMPQGGRIRVEHDGAAWAVTGEGTLRAEEALWRSLLPQGAPAPRSAALVHFALLPGLLRDLGRELSLDLGPSRIAARF